MRLTRKLTLALSVAILVVLGIDALLVVRNKTEMFEVSMRRDDEVLARTIAAAAGRVWRTAGEAPARDLVQNANERESDLSIRWVHVDAPLDSSRKPHVPREQIKPLVLAMARTLRWREPGSSSESLYTYYPIAIPLPSRAIEVRRSLEPERAFQRQTVLRAMLTTGVLVGICAVVALVLGAVLVGRPVRRLVEQARRVGAGDLSARLSLGQRDEIGELADEMNTMCGRLEEARDRIAAETAARTAALQQLRHADRLSTVGKVAAGLAHEIGTPLNVIIGHAQLITADHEVDSSAHRNAVVMARQAERVAEIIRQLLDFARPRRPAPTRHDMRSVIGETAALLRSVAGKHGVSVEQDLPDAPVYARVDSAQMMQALTNLMVNGIQAMPGGGQLILHLEPHRDPPPDAELAAGSYLCLEVRDHGGGIAAADVGRVFEPFFTTKGIGEGTGLGLSISQEIVREHGGCITAESQPGTGARFRIHLPEAEVE